MRKLFCVGCLVLLVGCQNVAGPFRRGPAERVDQPWLSIEEQQVRGRDKLALPVENNGLPSSGANIPGSPFTTR